jgi:hypothetical protein
MMARLILPFKGDTTDNSIHMLYDRAGTSLRLEQSLLRPMSPKFFQRHSLYASGTR